jgi:hypothetical protein
MALLIERWSPSFFRWHDSGDVFCEEYLHMILAVCRATPDTKHWIPTREYSMVERVRMRGIVPDNVCFRYSGDYTWKSVPPMDVSPSSHAMVINNMNAENWAIATESIAKEGGLLCQAKRRQHKCGSCRACWDPNIKHVVYPVH